jgi:uncharacterized protein DUF6505
VPRLAPGYYRVKADGKPPLDLRAFERTDTSPLNARSRSKGVPVKFLKAVRLDDSDDRVLEDEGGAAADGEWVVSGGYAVCDLAHGHRAPRCHCDTTFVAAGARRRCTIAEVADIDDSAYEQVKQALARHLLEDLGAPSPEAAAAVAQDECTYTQELAGSFPTEVWITVKREPTDDGVGERYSVFKRLMIGTHKL